MSTVYHCDGCDAPVAEPKELGHVVKRSYCDKCAEKASEFLVAEEALRKELHTWFTDERNTLIETHSRDGFNLPDVP